MTLPAQNSTLVGAETGAEGGNYAHSCAAQSSYEGADTKQDEMGANCLGNHILYIIMYVLVRLPLGVGSAYSLQVCA